MCSETLAKDTSKDEYAGGMASDPNVDISRFLPFNNVPGQALSAVTGEITSSDSDDMLASLAAPSEKGGSDLAGIVQTKCVNAGDQGMST